MINRSQSKLIAQERKNQQRVLDRKRVQEPEPLPEAPKLAANDEEQPELLLGNQGAVD